MTSLMTRMFKDRKPDPEFPMHGSRPLQTPGPATRHSPPKRRVSDTEWLWIILAVNCAAIWAAVYGLVLAWRAWA